MALKPKMEAKMLEEKIGKIVRAEIDSFVKDLVPGILQAVVDETMAAGQRVLKGVTGARRPGRPPKAVAAAAKTPRTPKAKVAAKPAPVAAEGEGKKRRKMSPEAKAKIVANLAKARAALAKKRKAEAKAAKAEAKAAEVKKAPKAAKNSQPETPPAAA